MDCTLHVLQANRIFWRRRIFTIKDKAKGTLYENEAVLALLTSAPKATAGNAFVAAVDLTLALKVGAFCSAEDLWTRSSFAIRSRESFIDMEHKRGRVRTL